MPVQESHLETPNDSARKVSSVGRLNGTGLQDLNTRIASLLLPIIILVVLVITNSLSVRM